MLILYKGKLGESQKKFPYNGKYDGHLLYKRIKI